MRLIAKIRALVTLLVLASHAPAAHDGYLGISLFVGRFSRVAAAQQFDPTHAASCTGSGLRTVVRSTITTVINTPIAATTPIARLR